MSSDPRLFELLARWQEQRRAGQALTPEQLCADCPELLSEVCRRIAALEGENGTIGGAATLPPVSFGGTTATMPPMSHEKLVAPDGSTLDGPRSPDGQAAKPIPGYEIIAEL